jgi:L-lactate utilization protein LutB
MAEIKKVLKALKDRRMNGYFVMNREEAKQKVLSLIDQKSWISWGGSKTIEEIGVFDVLRNGNYRIIDRESVSNPTTRDFLMKNAYSVGTFISGTNAITEDGKIVNMDGRGNRINAINYGPDKVIIVVGKNKIVKNLDAALVRIANTASTQNTKRLNRKTPCVDKDKCMDCRSTERICNIISIVQFQNDPNRIHVIIVDEDLGY